MMYGTTYHTVLSLLNIDFYIITKTCPAISPPQQLQPLQKACSQQVITWLTQKVSHWKFIARWLGLSETEVSRIISDNPNEDREQCYQMFVRWKAVSPESYTYPVLGEALRRESQELFNEFVKEVYRVETNIDLSSND